MLVMLYVKNAQLISEAYYTSKNQAYPIPSDEISRNTLINQEDQNSGV